MNTFLIFAVFLGLVGCVNANWNGMPTRRFIGMNDREKEGKFIGEPSGNRPTYTNWYKPTREPNNAGNQDCVEIDFRVSGNWNDISCTHRLPSVCQINLCPANARILGNMCYFISSEKATWREARERCYNQGGVLAEPRTAAQNNFLSRLTRERFWIGLSDVTNEGKYQWNSNIDNLGFFKSWDSRQPDNWRRNEDCIENNHAGRRSRWNDNTCTHKFRYACQKRIH